ncbi:MAG: diguanylate cyclase (GGDEF)-like protein [Gammaproteobacteria bacterium]|jgi:diguanylate cyclase (GGDEF)-like protein
MFKNPEQLQKYALKDLTNRAKGGIALYPAIWFVITLSYQTHINFPAFFAINAALLFCIFCSRLAHLFASKYRPEISVSKMYNWLVGSILLTALQWGLMLAFMLSDWDATDPRNVWIVVSMSLTIGGAVVLSISNAIRLFYPLLMIVPGICVLSLQGGVDQWAYVTIAILALVYIFSTTKVTHVDYWAAIENRFLAETRAEQMELLSRTDQLTQLNNRMYFEQRFAEEWKRSSRSESPLSILMLDLDHFKVINDSYGHVFGDKCLRQVAATLRGTVHRENDSIARFGGEEFVMLLPDTNQQDAQRIAAKVLKAVSEIILTAENNQINLTCSIGVATAFARHDGNREALLIKADDAMYLAKTKGRNRIQLS